jgi:multicomponent Na+:H+ antiporter subunit E
MMGPLAAAAGWLLIVWLALLGSLTLGSVLAGLTVAALFLLLFRPRRPTPGAARFRPLAALQFAIYFFYKLVQANLQVARVVVRADPNDLRRGIVAVPVVGQSDTVMTLLASAITLTPGSYVLDTRRNPPTLYIHVLALQSPEAVQIECLEMERRLVRAIGSRQALGVVEARLTQLGGGTRGDGGRA